MNLCMQMPDELLKVSSENRRHTAQALAVLLRHRSECQASVL